MINLTKEQINKISTPRLLAYINKNRCKYINLTSYEEIEFREQLSHRQKYLEDVKKFIDTYEYVKSVLPTREHVER